MTAVINNTLNGVLFEELENKKLANKILLRIPSSETESEMSRMAQQKRKEETLPISCAIRSTAEICFFME
jgi:hypothetical protein